MLSEVSEAPRELSEAVDEDIKEMKRELGASHEAQRKTHSSYNHNYHSSYNHNYYHNDF